MVLERVLNAVPLAVRSEVRERLAALRDVGARAQLWRWVVSTHALEPVPVVFVGRRDQRRAALGLLGVDEGAPSGASEAVQGLLGRQASILTEAPLPVPGALQVPEVVRMVFPVRSGRMKLQKRQRQLAEEHTTRPVTEALELERLYHEMLVPFANARHGEDVVPLTLDSVLRMAERGRVDLLLHGDTEMGVHVGYPSERGRKRYWEGCRVGYPRRVFSDQRLLGDTNTINFLHQLRRAEADGFDAYDMGVSPACPEGGLLQFKKRRGGDLDGWGTHHTYSFLPPPGRAPEVFWATPLFSREAHGLVLHLGVPAGRAPEEVKERYKDLHYRGLASVAVHGTAIAPAMHDALRAMFDATPIDVVAEPV